MYGNPQLLLRELALVCSPSAWSAPSALFPALHFRPCDEVLSAITYTNHCPVHFQSSWGKSPHPLPGQCLLTQHWAQCHISVRHSSASLVLKAHLMVKHKLITLHFSAYVCAWHEAVNSFLLRTGLHSFFIPQLLTLVKLSTWHIVCCLTITEWFMNKGNNEWINTCQHFYHICAFVPAFSLAK
jgi:hypothetical protein